MTIHGNFCEPYKSVSAPCGQGALMGEALLWACWEDGLYCIIAQGGEMDLGSRLDIFHLLEGFLSYVILLL
jgi:hypothetical protein